MPKQKDLKRHIRSRMKKTGESYTAARSQLIQKQTQTKENASASAQQYAALARMKNETVEAKTGKGWAEWVRVLDSIDATKLPHRSIARYVHQEHGIGRWWAQTVTVGYERIRGLREVGQRRTGAYECNKSKTYAVPLGKLYRAFSTVRMRNRWLSGVELQIRKSTPEKSMRIAWHDGTAVQVYFAAKGTAKSQVAIQHVKLPTKSAATDMKAYWSDRLNHLADILA